jgi:hypothetical protein
MTDAAPQLNVVHHDHSRIEHVDVGKYEVEMRVQVAMVNASHEMVFFHFFVDDTPQDVPWLWHSDGWETQTGWCNQTLTLAPNTTPSISIRLVWRHDQNLSPIFLETLHVPAAIDPREQYFFQRERIQAERRRAEKRRLHRRPNPVTRSWIRRKLAWLLEPL